MTPRFLFDQNISPRLVQLCADIYPDCIHVAHVGLHTADDSDVWQFAAQEDLAIVSKDGDFHQRSLLLGAPPKVIWVRLGNCSTAAIEGVLRRRQEEIGDFLADDTATLLVLS